MLQSLHDDHLDVHDALNNDYQTSSKNLTLRFTSQLNLRYA